MRVVFYFVAGELIKRVGDFVEDYVSVTVELREVEARGERFLFIHSEEDIFSEGCYDREVV